MSNTSQRIGSIERTLLLTLVRASNDDASFSPGYQLELRRFLSIARAEGGEISALPFSQTSAGTNDGLAGEFIIPCTLSTDYALNAAVTGWLLGRAGRCVRLTVDDLSVEGQSLNEVCNVLSLSIAIKPRCRSTQMAGV